MRARPLLLGPLLLLLVAAAPPTQAKLPPLPSPSPPAKSLASGLVLLSSVNESQRVTAFCDLLREEERTLCLPTSPTGRITRCGRPRVAAPQQQRHPPRAASVLS